MFNKSPDDTLQPTEFAESAPDAETEITSPKRAASLFAMVMGTLVPIGLGASAAVASRQSESERVGIAAWVAVAVVGTAAVISAARTMMPAHPAVEQTTKPV